jgi:hypothetical protein
MKMKIYLVCSLLFITVWRADCRSLVLSVKRKKNKAPSGTLGNPVAVDEDGLLIDVDVQSVDSKKQTTREDKCQDIDHFFLDAVFEDMDGM